MTHLRARSEKEEESPFIADGTCQQRELSIGGSCRAGLGQSSHAYAYTRSREARVDRAGETDTQRDLRLGPHSNARIFELKEKGGKPV